MTRSRRLVHGILTSTLSRGFAALVPILTVPLALTALGAVHYGAWTAGLSFTAFGAFADLGIGAGLMTALPAAIAKSDFRLGRRLVTTAYFALSLVTATGLAVIWLLRGVVDWGLAVGGKDAIGDPAVELIVLITLSGFATNIVAMLIVRLQQAAQQIARSNLWQTGGSVVGLLAMLIASKAGLHGAIFVVVAAFVPTAVSLLNAVLFFRTPLGRRLRPQLASFDWIVARSLASIGARFLVVNLLMSVALGSDAWVVAHTASLAAVPNFAIPARVFGVIGTVVGALTIPLWPTSADAIAAGDVAWVRRATFRLSIITPAIVGGVSALAAIMGVPLIDWWLGGKVHVDPTLLWGFALWNVVQAAVAPIFMVQNAVGILVPQTIGYAAMLLVVPAKWLTVTMLGTTWVPYVTVVAYCLAIWPAAIIGFRRATRLVRERNGVSSEIVMGADL